MPKSLVHSRFIRGLSAAFGIMSQPEGTVPRMSNLFMTKRGSLVNCNGSTFLAVGSMPQNSNQGNTAIWLEVYMYQLLGGASPGTRQLFGLLRSSNTADIPNHLMLIAIPDANPTFPVFSPSPGNRIADFGGVGGIVAVDSTIGGYGGGGGALLQGQYKSALVNPAVPMILSFVSKMVLCLGSGLSVFQSDGTAVGTVAITNTFSAQYPSWQANVNWLQNSLIQVNIAATLYVFKAIQGGISGTPNPPAFSATLNSTVADNQIVWQNIGQVTASPAPRGAAHGINYAGALWVANTNPSETTDGLDGPSAIRQSDINNINSWNPLNAAQIAKQDGTEITGLASFTIAEIGISPTGSLLVFKQFQTFQIIGVFGSTNLTIQPLQTDLGNIAPRSIQFIPGFGIMRLSHLGFALTNGVQDKLMSEELRPYLFGSHSADDSDIVPLDWNFAWFSKATQVADPPMYVCACPIIGGSPLTALTGASATQSGAGGTLSGTFFVAVSVFGASNYEYQVSPEFGPIVCVTLTNQISVTLPALPAGGSSFRIYFYQKTTSGDKINGYYVAGTASSVNIINTLAGATSGYPPSGLIGALTRLFCYDLVLKAWAIVDLPFPITVLKQFRMPGSIPINVMADYLGQSIYRVFANDTDFSSFPINWSVRMREIFGEGGSQELFMHRVIIRGFGQASAVAMTITPTYDGNNDPAQSVGFTALGNDQFEARLDLQRIARNVHLTLAGSGKIEIDAVEVEYEPMEVGAPIVIA